jgi:hypothetical protein
MIANVPDRNVIDDSKDSNEKEINDTLNHTNRTYQSLQSPPQYKDLSELALKFKALCDTKNEYKRKTSQKFDDEIFTNNDNHTDENNRKLKKTYIHSQSIRCIINISPGYSTEEDMNMNLKPEFTQATLHINELKSINFLNNMGKAMIPKSYSFVFSDVYFDYNSYLSLLIVWFEVIIDNGILIGSMFSSHSDTRFYDQIKGNQDSNRKDKKSLHVLPAVETFANIQSQSIFTTYDESSSLYCSEVNNRYRYEECAPGWYFYKTSTKNINV